MDGLLKCEICKHGAASHHASGCESVGCRCSASRGEVIEVGIDAAKDEIRVMWERPLPVEGSNTKRLAG